MPGMSRRTICKCAAMDLGNQRASGNVEDRRGIGMVGGGLGVGGIVVAVIAYFLGFDPGTAINVGAAGHARRSKRAPGAARRARATRWGSSSRRCSAAPRTCGARIFQQSGAQYRPPTLVLYDGQVRSACGIGQAAMGPFYCPNDEKLYIDLSFYRDLQTRFRAPGDFAQAYVIAHEVGHHVQKLTGSFQRLEAARGALAGGVQPHFGAHGAAGRLLCRRLGPPRRRRMKQLEPGDIDEALTAATAIGDDRLQKQAQGRVVPESFTHGTSEQRVRWFKRGLDSGNPKDCDTFSAANP